jgi:hypothetical protein
MLHSLKVLYEDLYVAGFFSLFLKQSKTALFILCPFKFQVQLFTPKKEKSVTVKQTGVV